MTPFRLRNNDKHRRWIWGLYIIIDSPMVIASFSNLHESTWLTCILIVTYGYFEFEKKKQNIQNHLSHVKTIQAIAVFVKYKFDYYSRNSRFLFMSSWLSLLTSKPRKLSLANFDRTLKICTVRENNRHAFFLHLWRLKFECSKYLLYIRGHFRYWVVWVKWFYGRDAFDGFWISLNPNLRLGF